MSLDDTIPTGIADASPQDTQGHSGEWHDFLTMEMRATARYQLLVQQLLAENDDDQGAVAKILEVKQPHVSRLKDGKRKASISAIELAVRKLKISPAFFFGPTPTEPHYRDFQGIRKLPPKMGYPALYRFFKMTEDGDIPITSREKAVLTDQEWDGDPTAQTYMLMLQALRTVQVPEDTVVRLRKPPQKKHERSEDVS